MSADRSRQILRLPRKHSRAGGAPPDPDLGARLARAQSVRAAITACLIVIVVFGAAWALISVRLDRVFPWATLLQSMLIGLAVRRTGRGLDWRFPVIAAVAALSGALIGNVVVAAAFTASELGTSTLTVLREVTSFTWPVFFEEVMNAADLIYAFFGAGLAAFYANRSLSRQQYVAYRAWRQEHERDD